jgi:hypothetical protein
VNDFKVPPMADVPPEVRARIESRVLPKLDADRRSRVWLPATAAGIALLVSGIVAVVHPGGGPKHPDTNPSVIELAVDSNQVSTELDRCWQAARQHAKEVTYPDRTEWRPVMSLDARLSTITAIQTGSGPLFCETTNGSVTLSPPGAAPAYAKGTKTGALLATVNGTIAGVVDPSWPKLQVMVTGKDRDGLGGPATQKDGLFIFPSFLSAVDETVKVGPGDNPQFVLPKPARPFGTVEPSYPAGDRSTPRGQQLGECISESGTAVPDADSWNPGAMVQSNGELLIMAANNGGVSACFRQSQRTQFMAYISRTTSVTEPKLLPVAPTLGGRDLVSGLLPPGVATMRLTFANQATMDADVRDNTFAALLPAGAGAPKTITCQLLGASDQILYTGPLAAS